MPRRRSVCGFHVRQVTSHSLPTVAYPTRILPIPQAVASALRSAPQLQVQLLTVLLSYAVDPVPNIRFNLAKALERLAPALAPLSEGAAPDAAAPGPVVGDALIRPALVGLTADRDEDVRFYSRKALAAFPAAAPLA